MLIVLLAVIVFAVAADQVSKLLIFGNDMPFIPGFIRFESVENRGMVWGFMNGVNGFTVVVSIFTVVVIGLLVYLILKYRRHMSVLMQICLAAIIGGAVGNLIDRVSLGYVRDFICTEFISFPVFNVADIFITCSAILLGVSVIFTRKGHELVSAIFPEKEKQKSDAGAE